jgi:hypothetical protein
MMARSNVGRRVVDLHTGELGTVVAGPFRGNRYQVHWDDPHPYQDDPGARPEIPSKGFGWMQVRAAALLDEVGEADPGDA